MAAVTLAAVLKLERDILATKPENTVSMQDRRAMRTVAKESNVKLIPLQLSTGLGCCTGKQQ